MDNTLKVSTRLTLHLARRVALFALVCSPVLNGSAVLATPLWTQDFEVDTDGWSAPTRVATGTNGITSAGGSFHAEAGADFTRFGGYSFVPSPNASMDVPGVAFPTYGFRTSLDIYLDIDGNVSASTPNGTKFEWDSALSKTVDGGFLRDHIFHVGFFDAATDVGDGSPGAGTNRFVIGANNNSGAGQNPKNAQDPFAVSTSGWYTFEHNFIDNGGTVAVEMSVSDSSGVEVGSILRLGDATDLIPSVVGGNRYGWFPINQFPFLAIDNAFIEINDAPPPVVPEPSSLSLAGIICLVLLSKRRRGRRA